MRRPSTETRRAFVRNASLCAAGALAWGGESLADESPRGHNKIYAFTKPFQQLSFQELADRVAELGFDGIEAPVRPGGHIEPANVEDQLPQLVEALAQRKLEIGVLASGIKSLDEPHTQLVLRTAAKLGIKKYRLAYYQYDLNQPVVDQIRNLRPMLRDLADFSGELGIVPLYQNHCGADLVGAPVWDVHELFDDVSADKLGMAFDLAHATIEGGQCWPLHVNLMWPYVQSLYVKDFVWNGNEVQWTPLGAGRIDSTFYRQLSRRGFRGPLSVHVEYLDHGDLQQQLTAFKQDLEQLRQWLRS